MKIFGNSKRNNRRDENTRKPQFNIIIDLDIVEKVQKMAKILRVNQSQMSEHLFEVGLHHIDATLKDPEKRKLLEKHMEISHLLNEDDRDEDIVIRMTENNSNWILLDHTQQLLDRMARISDAMQKAFMRKDGEMLDKLQKELNRLMAGYAKWIMDFEEDEGFIG
ncbi:hypothetical protein ACFLUG_02690 [Chloroflexota bacterium]